MRDYGAALAETTNGTNHIRYLVGSQALRLTTDAPIGYILDKRSFRLENDLHFFLGPDEPFSGNLYSEIRHDGAVHPALLAALGARAGYAARMAGRRDPLRDHAQALPARGNRRDRRRADHLDPRGARHRSATGTTATAGSAIPVTRSRRSTGSARSM